jgi:hypothetical protein
MKAGTGKIDITPTSNVWMDGMIRAHASVGVHDPLFARALVMSNDSSVKEGCAIVSVDVCGLTEPDATRVRSAVEAQVGIPARRVVLAATHTHSGPATVGYFNPPEGGYVRELSGRLVRVIEEAAAARIPVRAGCGSGKEETISHYRRLLADDGHVVMNWEPYPAEHIVGPLGEVDPEVGVLKIVDGQGQMVCLLFNHAGHPCVLSGDNYLLSAEYPGLAERLLEQELGGTAMFVNGAEGTMDIDGLRDRDWEGMERVGGALAAAVLETARAIEATEDGTLRCADIQYELPPRRITDQEWTWAEEVLKHSSGELEPLADGVGDDYKALLYKELRAVEARPIPVEQICFVVGDTAFLSFPGELFTEIGMRIKAGSPFRRTCIVGLANGSIGYVPSRKATQEGGYGVDTRRVSQDAEDIVVAKSFSLLRSLYRP